MKKILRTKLKKEVHLCSLEYVDTDVDVSVGYDHDTITTTTYYECKECGKIHKEVSVEEIYYNESDWR